MNVFILNLIATFVQINTWHSIPYYHTDNKWY